MIVKVNRCSFGVRFDDHPQSILIMSQTLSSGEYLHDLILSAHYGLTTYHWTLLKRPVTEKPLKR